MSEYDSEDYKDRDNEKCSGVERKHMQKLSIGRFLLLALLNT